MILVAGSTGVLGSEIVRRLLKRGEKVRVLVRESSDPQKVSALQSAGAEIARGDLKDRKTLEAACQGVKAVISTVSAVTTARPGDGFDETDAQGNSNLVEAAVRAGGEKFVFVSFDSDAVPDSPLVRAKKAVHDKLAGSGISYTILQPSLFMESWLGPMLFADVEAGTAKVLGSGATGINYIAIDDVAEAAVQALTSPRAGNAVLTFGGPEEVTQREALSVFSAVYGKQFSPIDIPEQALEQQWSSASDPFQKSFASLMLSVARGFGGGMKPASEYFPMQMTTVRDWVKKQAGSN